MLLTQLKVTCRVVAITALSALGIPLKQLVHAAQVMTGHKLRAGLVICDEILTGSCSFGIYLEPHSSGFLYPINTG